MSTPCAQGNGKKLSPSEIIKGAMIEGISLATKPEDIETAAKKAGLSCKKTQANPQEAQWSCQHGTMQEVSMNIVARGGVIKSIYRNGPVAATSVGPIMDNIDAFKAALNTRENVRFSQSEDVYSISFRHSTEAGEQSLDYNLMNRRMRDEKDPMKFTTQQVFTASVQIP